MNLSEKIIIGILGLVVIVCGIVLFVYFTDSDLNVITSIKSINNATFSIDIKPSD